MWPTRENSYSIASSPYKDGGADIVADFIASCKKYGIRPGLYYSTGCNGYYGINDSKSGTICQKNTATMSRWSSVSLSSCGEITASCSSSGLTAASSQRSLAGRTSLGLLRPISRTRSASKVRASTRRICAGSETSADSRRLTAGRRQTEYLRLRRRRRRRRCRRRQSRRRILDSRRDRHGQPQTERVRRRLGLGSKRGAARLPARGAARALHNVGRSHSNLLIGMCISQRGHFEDSWQFERFGELVADIYKSPAATTRGSGDDSSCASSTPSRYAISSSRRTSTTASGCASSRLKLTTAAGSPASTRAVSVTSG